MINRNPEDIKLLLDRLREPFPPPHHKERKLKGGGTYWFVPWRRMLSRINAMCPDAEIVYTEPQWNRDARGDVWTVRCSVVIAGVRRDGLGINRPDLNEKGEIKGIGDPVEVAAASAFRRACEAFGMGEYLRDQDRVKAMILDWQKQKRAATQQAQTTPTQTATNVRPITYARR